MLIKRPQVVLLHGPNRKLCERRIHTISLASTRVPTIRIRTLRPLTIFCGQPCVRARTSLGDTNSGGFASGWNL